MFFGKRNRQFRKWCERNLWDGPKPALSAFSKLFRYDRSYIDMGTLVDWPRVGLYIEIESRDPEDVEIERLSLLGEGDREDVLIRNFMKSKWNQSQGFEDSVFRQWWRLRTLTMGIENPGFFDHSRQLLEEQGCRLPKNVSKDSVSRDAVVELNMRYPSGYQRYEAGVDVFGDLAGRHGVHGFKAPARLSRGETLLGSVTRSDPEIRAKDGGTPKPEDEENAREVSEILRATKIAVTGFYGQKRFIAVYGIERLPGRLTGDQPNSLKGLKLRPAAS